MIIVTFLMAYPDAIIPIVDKGALLMVALGMYDLSVVGNHQLKSVKANDVGIKPQFVLSEPLAHRWAVRAEDQQLNNALNKFI